VDKNRLHPVSTKIAFLHIKKKELEMEQPFITVYIVDAFTNEIFSGNPAAVCCLENVSNFNGFYTY